MLLVLQLLCPPLPASLGAQDMMPDLTKSLKDGMTLVASYWQDKGMTWLDGSGAASPASTEFGFFWLQRSRLQKVSFIDRAGFFLVRFWFQGSWPFEEVVLSSLRIQFPRGRTRRREIL